MISSNIQMGRHSIGMLVYNDVYMIIKRNLERKMKRRVSTTCDYGIHKRRDELGRIGILGENETVSILAWV